MTTSVRINLLPHRAQKRMARKRQFVSLAVLLSIAALAVVGLVHLVMANQIDRQNNRNKLLQGEIDKLDDQIKQVLARKQVVESLQANRNEAVHLLDQLVRQLPDGIYLRSVHENGIKVQIVGYAQSNARVSTLMRNIEGSPWLTKPDLVEVKLVSLPSVGNQRASDQKVSEFTLNFEIKRETPSIDNAPKSGAARKGKA